MRTPPLLADFTHIRVCKPFCEISLTLPRLKLAQAFQYALPPGRRCLFFFGGFSFFPDLAFPFGKLPVVVLYHGFRLAVGRHERPYIGIAVLF